MEAIKPPPSSAEAAAVYYPTTGADIVEAEITATHPWPYSIQIKKDWLCRGH